MRRCMWATRASKNYLQAHGARIMKLLPATSSKEAKERGGVARVSLWLLGMGRSYFEKIKSKDFKKGVEPRLQTARGGDDQTTCGRGEDDGAIDAG
jgi:hypothetical protein